MDQIEIQIMQMSPDGRVSLGNWMTVEIVFNDPQHVVREMQQVQSQYPAGTRVRAGEHGTGRLVDILA